MEKVYCRDCKRKCPFSVKSLNNLHYCIAYAPNFWKRVKDFIGRVWKWNRQ